MQFQSSIHLNEMQTNVRNKFNFPIFKFNIQINEIKFNIQILGKYNQLWRKCI